MVELPGTSNRSFQEVVGNGVRLEVPRFQRDYSWAEEQWADLWEDIVSAKADDEYHYLGFIVLQRKKDNEFIIIDGQQRITTLSLFILSALKDIIRREEPTSQARASVLRSSYIGRQDPVTLTTHNKLTLNRNNAIFYAHYLSELRELSNTDLKSSELLLQRAFQYFGKKVSSLATGEAVAEWVEFVANRMFFTVINVTSELNAYRVFETLNARGVQLSAADLLKNYLFSVVDAAGVHESELQQLEERWDKIQQMLRKESFANFLRAYWVSKYERVRSPQLFRAVREKINSSKQVFELLRDLVSTASDYIALRNPYDEAWHNLPVVREQLEALQIMGVRQQIALLLAGRQSLDEKEFQKLLQHVVAFSFRYNKIAGRSSGDQETLYASIALELRNTQHYDPQRLLALFPADEVFLQQFRVWTISPSGQSQTFAKYLLTQIERQARSNKAPLEARNVTLEHILPQSASESWPDFEEHNREKLAWRLGNLTLLEQTLNAKAGQLPIQQKLEIYAVSSFKITQDVDTYIVDEAWTAQSINKRQIKLARLAKSIWRIQ